MQKIKNWVSEYWWILVLTTVFALLISTVCVGAYVQEKDAREQEAWYNALSPAEKAEYDAKIQAEYDANVYEYEVLNVYRYMYQETNRVGGVIKEYPVYVFSHLDNGVLKEENHFRHYENGSYQVKLGDQNRYVINKNNPNTWILYLTEETLRNLATVS